MSENQITRKTSESANTIFEELDGRNLGTLGILGKDKLPHLTAVYYSVNENFEVVFATKQKTRKYQSLQSNPSVQLLVFDEKHQLTIQVSGEAEEIRDADQRALVIEDMYRNASSNNYNSPPIAKLFAGEYVAFKIVPKQISMAFFMRPQEGGYDMFETLDFRNES